VHLTLTGVDMVQYKLVTVCLVSCKVLWTFCLGSAVLNKESWVYCQLTFYKVLWVTSFTLVVCVWVGTYCRISNLNSEVPEIQTAWLLKTWIFNFRRSYRGSQILLPRHV